MIEEIIQEARERMNKSVSIIEDELVRIRTGRANTALLDYIQVDYYGTATPIAQCATVGIQDARTISVQPWEDINKAVKRLIKSLPTQHVCGYLA